MGTKNSVVLFHFVLGLYLLCSGTTPDPMLSDSHCGALGNPALQGLKPRFPACTQPIVLSLCPHYYSYDVCRVCSDTLLQNPCNFVSPFGSGFLVGRLFVCFPFFWILPEFSCLFCSLHKCNCDLCCYGIFWVYPVFINFLD